MGTCACDMQRATQAWLRIARVLHAQRTCAARTARASELHLGSNLPMQRATVRHGSLPQLVLQRKGPCAQRAERSHVLRCLQCCRESFASLVA